MRDLIRENENLDLKSKPVKVRSIDIYQQLKEKLIMILSLYSQIHTEKLNWKGQKRISTWNRNYIKRKQLDELLKSLPSNKVNF